MSIHISSGHCVSIPNFNIAEDNKIKSLNCSYNRIYEKNIYFFNKTYTIAGMVNNAITPESQISGDYDESYLYYVNDQYKYAQISITVDLSPDISRFNINNLDNLHISITAEYDSDGKTVTYRENPTRSNLEVDKKIMSGTIISRTFEYPEEIKIEPYSSELNNELWILPFGMKNKLIEKNKIKIMFGLNCVQNAYAKNDFNKISVVLYSMNTQSSDTNIIDPKDDSFYTYGVEETKIEGSDFSVSNNELFNNQVKIGNEEFVGKYVSDIISKWQNGRQTMSLTCIYGRYYSYDPTTLSKDSTEVALNGKDGKMIEVGDIVVPTRLYTNQITNSNYELPIAVDKDGNALEFEVLSSEIEFNNGKLVTHLKLMEVK